MSWYVVRPSLAQDERIVSKHGRCRRFFGCLRSEVAQNTVFHVAEVARVYKKRLAFSVTPAVAGGLGAGEEPDARRDLRVCKKLPWQCDHAFDEVGLDQCFANLAFVVGVGAHGAVGEQQRQAAVGREVVHHVLQPGEVGIAGGRHAVLPAHVVIGHTVFPFLHVKRRVGHDVVGTEVGVLVARETVGGLFAEVEVHSADGHVHRRKPPGSGIGLLTVNRNLPNAPAVLLNEFLRLHEETTGATAGIVNAPLEWLKHLDDYRNDGLWRVVLPALLAFGHREFAEEVFIHVAEDVLCVQRFVMKRNARDQIDQAGKHTINL